MTITTRRETRIARRHKYRSGLPQTLMEIFAIPLMLLVMSRPEFGLRQMLMPKVFTPDGDDAPVTQELTPYPVEVLADGRVLCRGEETPPATVVQRIQQDIQPTEFVRVSIETDEGGTGNIESLLQLQRDLSKPEFRTRILHRTPRQDRPHVEGRAP